MSERRLSGSVVEFSAARGWVRVLGVDGMGYLAEVTDIETPVAVGDVVEFTPAFDGHAATVRQVAR